MDQLEKLLYEDIWNRLRSWDSILQDESVIIPDDFKGTLSCENLERFKVNYSAVRSKEDWTTRLMQLFNMDERDLCRKGMQYWKNLSYINQFCTYKTLLPPQQFEQLKKRIISKLKTNPKLVIPAFEINGKYFTAKRQNENIHFKVYVQ